MRTLRLRWDGRIHFASSVSPPFTLYECVMRRLFDVAVLEMGPHICQLTEAVVPVPMAILLLHRRYLATLVHLGNRLRSTSRHLEHKNCVRSPFCAFRSSCCVQFLSLVDTAVVALLTAQFLPESSAHVFNAGASVWGLDWCPIHPDDRPRKNTFVCSVTPLTSRAEPDCSYKYYLAVAPLPSRAHSPEIGIKVPRPSRSCIQLWSLGRSTGVGESGDDKGYMHCEMVLCIDSGAALELKWCPLPSHDPVCPESLCYC